MNGTQPHENKLAFISLFGSVGTLLCCALPSLLVLAGLGTAVASILGSLPWLITVSKHKEIVFITSGLMIALNFLYVYNLAPRLKSTGQACSPGDDACHTASRITQVFLWISAFLYVVGVFTAFILGPILVKFE